MNGKMLAVLCLGALLCVPLAASDADASDGFDVTDAAGFTYHYDGPSDHIVSTGAATTHTLGQLGVLSKVAATDSYGSRDYVVAQGTDAAEDLADLDAVNLGSIFGSDIVDSFEAELPKLVEEGKLCLDDTVILTTSSKITAIKEKLNGLGFTHVLLYKSLDSYDQVVEMMRTLSLVSTGSVDGRVQAMEGTAAEIKERTSALEPAKALCVWYNSNGLAVGNTGIMSSMLEICNATQVGLDESVGKGYYGSETDIVQLIGGNPGVVVFVNHSYFAAGNTVADFRDKLLGGDESIEVVEMGSLWNNYCFEIGDALETIAGVLYPEADGASDGTPDDGSGASSGDGSDALMYAAIAVAVVAAVACAAVCMARRPREEKTWAER